MSHFWVWSCCLVMIMASVGLGVSAWAVSPETGPRLLSVASHLQTELGSSTALPGCWTQGISEAMASKRPTSPLEGAPWWWMQSTQPRSEGAVLTPA